MRDNHQAAFRPRGRVVVRKIGDDTLLVPVSGPTAGGGQVYPVNETAACVWACLAEGGTVSMAASELARVYAVTEEEARTDCEACLRAFLDEGLLERCEE